MEEYIRKIRTRDAYRIRVLCSGITMKLDRSSLIDRLYFVRSFDLMNLSNWQVYKAWVDLNARVDVTRKPQIPAFIQSKPFKYDPFFYLI